MSTTVLHVAVIENQNWHCALFQNCGICPSVVSIFDFLTSECKRKVNPEKGNSSTWEWQKGQQTTLVKNTFGKNNLRQTRNSIFKVSFSNSALKISWNRNYQRIHSFKIRQSVLLQYCSSVWKWKLRSYLVPKLWYLPFGGVNLWLIDFRM